MLTFAKRKTRSIMLFKARNTLLILLLLPGRQLVTNAQNAVPSYSLRAALQSAKENNLFLKTQSFNTGLAEADKVTAGLRPNLILNNQSLHIAQPTAFSPGTDWLNRKNQQIWWQLTKPVQLPGQRNAKMDFAAKNVSATEKLYHEAERNLFFEVGSKWVDVWSAQKQVESLSLAKANIDSLLAINRVRLRNQVITQSDLIRTELLSDQYAVELKNAARNFRNEQLNLKTLLGSKEEVSIDTADTWIQYGKSESLDSMISGLSDTRSDLLLLRDRISLAESNMRLQKAMAIPQPELGLIYNPQNTVRYLGLYATWELPIWSRNQGEVQKSKVSRNQAQQDFESTAQIAQTEIIAAYQSCNVARESVQSFQSLLAKSDQILSSVRYAYLRGGTTIVDLLEAQRSWLDARQQYYRLVQQYRQSYLQLLFSSGLINQLAN